MHEAPKPAEAPKDQRPKIKSIDDVIAESNNEEALKIKKEIDALKQQRKLAIGNIHQSRRKLEYKEKEERLVAKKIETDRGKISEAKKMVWKLKRQKEKLEFRISTEAKSLSAEKDLIRQINEVGNELEEAFRYVRLDRKLGLVKKDIEQSKTLLMDSEKKLEEVDKGLDLLYGKVREILGIKRRREGSENNNFQQRKPHHHQQQPQQEINLEDIAVIKRK